MLSIESLAGRARQMPVSIFQDVETLDRIADGAIAAGGFDYDLADPEFQAYLKARGVLYSAGKPGTAWWTWCAAPNGRTLEQFRQQEEFRFAQEYPPESGQRHEFTKTEQEFHWNRLKRTWARLADGWELFRAQAGDYLADSRQPAPEIVAILTEEIPEPASTAPTNAERAQRLLEEAQGYGVIFERHGDSVDKTGGDFPKGRWKTWKTEYNEVWREFLSLLPDTKSLMQQPEGFTEVSPGNFVHQDDLPTVTAMMAMAGIERPEEPAADPQPPELFRPANGTMGESFMADHCYRCSKWGELGCEIQARTMAFDTDDPEYPREWICTEDGGATCTAFDLLPQPAASATPTGPQPNENGVFPKEFHEIPWQYADKRLKASIMIVEFLGAHYSTSDLITPTGASYGCLSVSGKCHPTKIEAIQYQAGEILRKSESLIKPDTPNAKSFEKTAASLKAFLGGLEPQTEPIPEEQPKPARAKRARPAKPGWTQDDLFGFEGTA